METNPIHQAIIDTNLLTVGQSSAVAIASTMLTQAHTTGIMFEQATHQLGLSFQTSQASTAKSIQQLLESSLINQRTVDSITAFAEKGSNL